jgi:transcriptional regulator with XRE-family HTH domain
MMTEHLLKALKQALRTKGVSYRAAAGTLGLSESSIKRLFAEKGFTLPRLEKLCELAEIDIAQLVQLAEASLQQVDRLSIEQEQEIVDDPKLLIVGVCLINQCSFDEILQKYNIAETELIRCFAKFDSFNIIEYLPGNNYRLKLSRSFSWNDNGPIKRYFLESLMKDFLTHEIISTNNHLHYVWGMLTVDSAKTFVGKIQKVVDEYSQLAGQDARLPMNEKMTSSLLVLFREDWEPGMFKALWRSE